MAVLTVLLAVVAVLVCLLLLGYIYATWTHGMFRQMGIPAPEPGLLGIVGRYKKEGIGGCDQRLVKEYGRVVGVFHGRIPSLIISDPAMIKQICVKDFSNFVNRSTFGPVPKIVMDCIAEIYDEHWKFMRCVLSPTFRTSKLKQMMELVERCSDLLVKNVDKQGKEKKSVDMKHVMGCYTMDVIAHTGFSIDLDSQSDPDNVFVTYCRKAFKLTFPIIFLVTLLFPFTKSIFEKIDFQVLDFDKDKAKFRAVVKQVIEDRKNNPDSGYGDILQTMLDTNKEGSARDPDDDSDDDTETTLDFKYYKKRGLTNYEIFCNSHIFLLAGFETTSKALTFTAYNLATHPEIQERLYQSIIKHIGNNKPTYAEVTKLQYLENVFMETLRLFPPATRNTRVAAKSTTINGYHIPAGMPVIIPVYAVQHDPEFWADPEKFDPDRFLPENKHELHEYMWMPFGVGPRNCLGMRLALLEAKMAIVALVQNFRFVVTPETIAPEKLQNGVFIRPETQVFVGVERRE
ncbi:cytochrome P450 3A8-like isoform X2 [Haliotis rufescens]|uniref:cytochrome P450 3A8-like isoform X2 n=1 Tax=Haliotis rufescens TaxID=6454 RepID=UPI001EAFBB39|nr:cytochrome P450 3A8-like isoform X2 [Haliotis rufescens]